MSKPRKPLSEAHKKKIQEATLGRVHSEHTRALMSLASKGRPKTEAHRKRLCEVLKKAREAKAAKAEQAKLAAMTEELLTPDCDRK